MNVTLHHAKMEQLALRKSMSSHVIALLDIVGNYARQISTSAQAPHVSTTDSAVTPRIMTTVLQLSLKTSLVNLCPRLELFQLMPTTALVWKGSPALTARQMSKSVTQDHVQMVRFAQMAFQSTPALAWMDLQVRTAKSTLMNASPSHVRMVEHVQL
jgi:hypothetical protein